MKPLIGINASVTAGGAGEMPAVMVRTTYIDAVVAAGGIPVMLPAVLDDDVIEAHAGLCAGYIFVGGPDIDPARYGVAERHPTSSELPVRREGYDLSLIRKVIDSKKPFLAVCLGCQEVNVVLGGTLIQDITSQTDSNVQHSQKHAPYFHRQLVKIDEDSLLGGLVGSGEVNANTAHHQVVDVPGKGLKVTARCVADNLIEALELENYDFGIAVQWHPEMLVNEEQHLNLFRGLVTAASGGGISRETAAASDRASATKDSLVSSDVYGTNPGIDEEPGLISLEACSSGSLHQTSDPASGSI